MQGGLLISWFLISSCKNGKSGLMKQIYAADSAAIMYYETPNNPRFFKYVKIHDLEKLKPLMEDINGILTAEGKECATDCKIYFYEKKGAVSVAYFSRQAGCNTVSFIITGEKYYTSMSGKSKTLLDELQKNAVEPKAADGQ
jgi:hypothetical protein